MEYLEGNEPDVPTLRKLVRKATLAMAFVPVLGGSAFKNKGVQPLLNAVVDYLPSPLDVVDYMGFRPAMKLRHVISLVERMMICHFRLLRSKFGMTLL